MRVLVVTCKLVLTVEAVFAAELAAKYVAWESRGFGAMSGSVVPLQITKLLAGMAAIPLGALISLLVFKMGFLVFGERLNVFTWHTRQTWNA